MKTTSIFAEDPFFWAMVDRSNAKCPGLRWVGAVAVPGFHFFGGGGETKTAPLSPSVSGCFAVLCPGSALVGWGQGAELPGSALLGGVRGLGLLP